MKTVRSNAHRRQTRAEEHLGLVAGMLGVQNGPRRERQVLLGGVAAVAARQDSGPAPPLVEDLRQPQHAGRLAGAAHGDITEGDHRCSQLAAAGIVAPQLFSGAPSPQPRQDRGRREARLRGAVARHSVQLAHQGHGAGGGAAARLRRQMRASPNFAGQLRRFQQPSDRAGQCGGVFDLHARARRAEFVCNGLEVLHVRPDDHGLGEKCGLENIVPAAAGQGSAHEDRVRHGKQAAQFADGIQQKHRRKRQRFRAAQSRAAQVGNPGRLQFPRRRVETLRLSRRQNQQQVRAPRGEFLERPNRRVVFVHVAGRRGRHGAGGDPHFAGPHALEQSGHRGAGRRRARREVVLEIAAGAGTLGKRLERQKPLAHGVRLRQDGIGRGQYSPKEPPEGQVARKSPVGDAAIDDRQARAGAVHLTKEIGPDLGLRNHHGRGAQRAQHAPHRPHVIHGRVKYAVGQIAQLVAGGGAARQGRGGDEKPGAWELRPQAAQEFHARQDLAHRNCMQPDGPGAGLSKRTREEAEALRQTPPVAAVPQTAKQEIQ